MAPQDTPRMNARPRAKTPAERAEEATAVQRRLKREAAERRLAAAAKQPSTTDRDSQARASGRRRTP